MRSDSLGKLGNPASGHRKCGIAAVKGRMFGIVSEGCVVRGQACVQVRTVDKNPVWSAPQIVCPVEDEVVCEQRLLLRVPFDERDELLTIRKIGVVVRNFSILCVTLVEDDLDQFGVTGLPNAQVGKALSGLFLLGLALAR